MIDKRWSVWFVVVAAIQVLWGIVFAFFGLGVLPVSYRGVLLRWESALYGSIMIGWGLTLILVGRVAFNRHDPALLRALLSGLVVWLLIEGLFSAYLGVWFNVGVDAAVLLLFSLPLLRGLRQTRALRQPDAGRV